MKRDCLSSRREEMSLAIVEEEKNLIKGQASPVKVSTTKGSATTVLITTLEKKSKVGVSLLYFTRFIGGRYWHLTLFYSKQSSTGIEITSCILLANKYQTALWVMFYWYQNI